MAPGIRNWCPGGGNAGNGVFIVYFDSLASPKSVSTCSVSPCPMDLRSAGLVKPIEAIPSGARKPSTPNVLNVDVR